MTLKTILKNFLNYADTLETQKKLGKDIYEADFQKLKGLTEELKRDKDYSTSEGLKEVNRRKNRYKDILPYDYTRVILSEYPGVPGSDYINANYIKGASGSLAYIASQGPLPNTVVDFWRMIWECEVQVIVMACNEQESGKYKCECYWPTDEEKKQYGNINVEFVKWRQVCPDFLVRTLKACWENEERVICQFHYTTWPDHGVPNSVQPILELVRLIRDCQASEAVPVLIHCSAGCGRTGTICAIDYVWGLMRMGKLTKNFNLYNVIADMRRQRIAMVQTKEQYVLVHKAVSSLFEQQLRVIDSHTYENLDEDGEPLILKELHQQEEDIYEDILDPPLGNESFISSEKQLERKHQPCSKFQDYASNNTEVPPIPSKRDPFPENLLNFSKNLYYKTESDKHLNKTEKNENHSISNQKENTELRQNVPKVSHESENPYSRNSQILMKLCREESVKRLITGWNKAAEQPDDIKNITKDLNLESDFYSKNPGVEKVSDYNQSEQKTCTLVPEKCDVSFTPKAESNIIDSVHKSENLSNDHNSRDIFSKNNSPDDIHAGKLVGKATVIRRPSIAKLKALFEKTPQSNSDLTENGRRRTLFRSHSHYISHTSRTFTLSDNASHSTSSNLESNLHSALRSDESKSERDRLNSHNNIENDHSQNLESINNLNMVYPSQHFSAQNSVNHFHSSSEDKKTTFKSSFSSIDSKDNSKQINSSEHSANHTNIHESQLHTDLNASTKMKVIQTTSSNSKKDKPPELPLKKKSAVPLSQTSNLLEKNKDTEVTVPRFKVNMPKDNLHSESTNKLNTVSIYKENVNKNSNHNDNFLKDAGKVSVASPDWNSDDSLREYVRRSQDVERHILRKNQSFSDPEQSARYLDQTVKQVSKPKLSLTEQTYPKLTCSAEKGLDEKVSFTHERAYMNVNSLAQKNIRQIEEKLKNHPRGAIIDLTSRKSFIDEMASASDRPYVFRNICEPVKFLPCQEVKELSSQEKNNNKIEHSMVELASKSQINVSSNKSAVSKVDSSKTDMDHINSKNLLLHSPPPKSKRGHSSKTNLKSQLTTPNSQDSDEVSSENIKLTASSADKTSTTKVISSSNYLSASVPSDTNTSPSNSSPAADRSDPRYFPVTRQTASDARYESERHKAEAREAASGRQVNAYEPLYSNKPINSVYQKLPQGYDKSLQDTKVLKESKYAHDNNKIHLEKEPIYGLQRSTSGPQILPSSDNNPKNAHSAEMNRLYNVYGQLSEDNKMNKAFHSTETRANSQYDSSQAYAVYGKTGQHIVFPPGPPKPPRTFHYDMKSNQEKIPESHSKPDQNVKREGGRYIVSVASPKHSNVHNPVQSASNVDYRYERVPNMVHVPNNSVYQPQTTYVSPLTNEVHMSRSYPFTNYDRSYYPRPYGKQYYPESVAFRTVQPLHPVSNNVYAVPEKPAYSQQNIYGTVKHRNTFSDYENVYDNQVDYVHAVSASKSKNDQLYQSVNNSSMAALQYSQSDASVYGVLQPPKSHVKNDSESSGNSVSKRVYFDTLQRRNKQHVTWEQRRSHDDMDIRPPPSARLREQIHARRSMVELDNLEITVATDEGYPEKSIADALTSPTNSFVKATLTRNDKLEDRCQGKSPGESNESIKEYRRKSVPTKEPATFGETLSKAFGRLTSFTKFNAKEAQSCSAVPGEASNNSSKGVKQKEKDKHQNYSQQSPTSPEDLPSEQWTQV